ncbi:MAG: futalosine hydrolase [Desulfobacteraceae bacterium 4572_35.1]|nr:MAG: futalosine hydrolase [Desulfobacteraceae bacterium 4572_35.1]
MTTAFNRSTTMILTAVPAECEQLKQELNNNEQLQCGHLQLTGGYINEQHYLIGHCGLGKSSAAAAVATIVNTMTISRLIMIGCAGAYPESGLKIGDIAVATEEILTDEGVQTCSTFLDLHQLNFALVNHGEEKYYHRFPCDKRWLDQYQHLFNQYAMSHKLQCKLGPFATLSTCSGTSTYGKQIYQRSKALVENMEGAAAAQICAQYHIPFTEIRAISNMVENRNMANWDLAGAMQRAQHCLLHLLQHEETTPCKH